MLRALAAVSVVSIAVTLVYSLPSLHRSKRWEEFPNVTFTFDCTDRPVGFYADQEFNCQLFHMCDEDGRRIPYMCANETAFNQQFRICDWKINFDCSSAHEWFYLNEYTYVTDPPKF
ncbi:U-scoloptoxin(01)-Er1a-like [Panulirus ornatus]|uniref:U-scoloptoxin(01)-Er1a-like n=1 Tax=Panulirus ornatus TaxID=150431 RepID=UPI003A849C79